MNRLPDAPTLACFGIYVHYPYCARHCPYCDFTVAVTREIPHARYRDAVLAELSARAPAFAHLGPAVSLYFGGGTPGLWPAACVGAVIDAVAAGPGLAADAEITIECNPEDVDAARLRGLRLAGVNRLSLGAQSFDDALLLRLGRAHTADDVRRAVALARGVGFEALSLDLMHGEQGQTLAAALADVDLACDLAPTHVSTYQLTIEARTSFGARARRGEALTAPDDDLAVAYDAIRAALRARGVLPYEISNAALPGHEAVHNTLYWTGQPYLALGAGAHGFLSDGRRGERWENERHAGRYMAAALSGAPAESWREVLDAETLLEERILTGLRLDRGVRVDADLEARFGAAARRLARRGELRIDARRWAATDRGRAVLNRVVLDLVSEPR